MFRPSRGYVGGCPCNLLERTAVQAYRRTNHPLRPIAMQQQCVFRQRTGSVNNLLFKARLIQNKLAADPMYTGIFPAPAEVMIFIEELTVFQAQISMRNYHCKPKKDAKRKQLDMALAQQCKWVNAMANNNLDFLTNSGFDLSKSREPIQEPATARISQVITLQEGVAIVKAKHIDNTRYYEALIFGPNGYKKKVTGLYADITVPNLPTGVALAVKVRSVNHKGNGQWSGSINFVLPIPID